MSSGSEDFESKTNLCFSKKSPALAADTDAVKTKDATQFETDTELSNSAQGKSVSSFCSTIDLTKISARSGNDKFGKGIRSIAIEKVINNNRRESEDLVSVEEPLEIRIAKSSDTSASFQQVAVTMRTPGNDKELATGFLFTEGIINVSTDIVEIHADKCNVVTVTVSETLELAPEIFARHSFVASSCGVCGKKTIDSVKVKKNHCCKSNFPVIQAALIHELPDALRQFQSDFERTGGLHASALFNTAGELIAVREDVGRHNALDKLIGSEFLSDRLPLVDRILMVSGRASFELVQKAAHAGLGILVAVGAPSSLAVELAEECEMTLVGFTRNNQFNIYSGFQRITNEN